MRYLRVLSEYQANNFRFHKFISYKLHIGKIILLASDTVHAIIASSQRAKSINLIYKIKKRNYDKKIPIIVQSLKAADKLLGNYDQYSCNIKSLLKSGNLTIIDIKKGFFNHYINDSDNIALRVTNASYLKKIINNNNIAIAATSANCSGKKEIIDIKCWKSMRSSIVDYVVYYDYLIKNDNLSSSIFNYKSNTFVRNSRNLTI